MYLCILSEKNTQDTLEKKRIKFAHTLRKHLKTHTREKSNKCNQYTYKTNATNATILSYRQFEESVDIQQKKSHTNAISVISVTINLHVQTF